MAAVEEQSPKYEHWIMLCFLILFLLGSQLGFACIFRVWDLFYDPIDRTHL